MSEPSPDQTSNRRDGRGRLSSIDMLPEEADEAIAWANAALRERKMPQTEILRQFNAMLADHGIRGVSKGAFSRWSVRVAVELRKLDAQRRITDQVLGRLQPGETSDSAIAAAEMLKFRIMELVCNEDEVNGKALATAALTLQRLSSVAARASEAKRLDRKDQREADERQRAEQEREQTELADSVEKIATEAGLGAERIAAIRKGVLGLSV